MRSTDSKTIKAYDEQARQYCEYLEERIPQYNLTKFTTFLLKMQVDSLYDKVKKGSKARRAKKQRILDIGCGGGRDVLYLAEEGFDVTGIDASPNIIKLAKKRVKGAKFKVMDLKKLDFQKMSFDGLWCLGPLCHIEKKDAASALAGFNDVLVPGGVLFISVPLGEGEGFVERKELMGKKVYYARYAQSELETLLEEQGFAIMSAAVEDAEEKMLSIFAQKEVIMEQ